MRNIFSYTFTILAAFTLILLSCKKEKEIRPSDGFGFEERFSPDANDLSGVKKIYDEYQVWLRMDFEDANEVTNAILVQDPSNRYGAEKIDDDMRESAIMFLDTLLHNSSKDFVKRVFPREFFFVKTYNGSFWKADIQVLGRSRLIVCWPNEREGVQPITIPETHYYQDSILTRMVWSSLSSMLAQRMEGEIPEFEAAGLAYDNGKALDEFNNTFQGSTDERNQELAKFAAERGLISASGSRGYRQDIAQWIQLLATESYQNIKRSYLDTSDKRAAKYELFVKYFKDEFDWDIQETGNKFRRENDKLNK